MGLSLNWSQAEQNCVCKGGHLASIHSEEENDFIKRWYCFIHNNVAKAFFNIIINLLNAFFNAYLRH